MLNKKYILLFVLPFFAVQGILAQVCDYVISPSTHHNWVDVVAQRKTNTAGPGFDSIIVRNSRKIQASSEPLDVNDDLSTRTFIKFDLFSTRQNMCEWKSARLHLKFTGNSVDSHSIKSGANDFIISRIIEPWGEDTLRWKTIPTTNPYRMPLTTTEGEIRVTGTKIGDEDYDINIVSLLKFWTNNPDSNFGFEIRLVDETGTRGLNFTGSEFPSPLVQPYITATTKACKNYLADAGVDVTICQGQTYQLDGNHSEFFEWTSDPTLSNIYIADPIASPTSTTTYYLKTTLGSCVSEDSITVRVDNYAVISTGPDQDICFGEDVQISASGAINYEWTPKGDILDRKTATPTVDPKKTTTFYVTADDNSICTTLDSVKVIVRPLTKTDAGKDVQICEGDTAFLLVSGGNTHQWINNTAGLSATNIHNPIATPTLTTTYTVQASNGFCPVEDEITVKVIPKFTVNAGNDRAICFGEVFRLEADRGFPFYQWEPGNSLSESNISRPKVTNLQKTTTFTLVVADENQCTATDEVTVTVNPLPYLEIGADTFICITKSIELAVDSISDGDFTFLWDQQFGLEDLNDTSARDISIKGASDTILTYGLSIEDVNGCKAYDDIVVTTLPSLEVDVYGGDTTICSGTIIELGVRGAITFKWSGNEDEILSRSLTRSSIQVQPTKPSTFQVEVTNGEECGEAVALIDVDVIQKPLAYAHLINTQDEQDTLLVCKGSEVELEGVGAEQYVWSTGDTAETTIVRQLTPTSFVSVYGISKGCIGPIDSILLMLDPDPTCFSNVFVPNAFNPYSPIPENKVFTIYPYLIRDYKMSIFDRWGAQIFFTEDQTEFWDGTYNGELLQEGVYYYLIEAFGTDEESRNSNGTIQVIY